MHFSLNWLRRELPIVCQRISLYITILEKRRVWRYQRGNQNQNIEEQTTQWPKEKVQKDKQRSTKHTYKTKDRLTRTPLKTGGELKYFGRVSSSCSTIGTHLVNLVTNTVIGCELEINSTHRGQQNLNLSFLIFLQY